MLARLIVEIGLNAYERGFLERERLVEALSGALTLPPETRPETFWSERAGLSAEQLDQIMLAPGALSSVASSVSKSKPENRDVEISILIASSILQDSQPESTVVSDGDELGAGGASPSRFSRVGVLGVGGMGEVLEFEDTRIGRHVAIKRVKPGLPNPERASALLEREARITGRLEHPNIVPLYDMGSEPASGPYYIMRLLTHPTLAQVLLDVRRRVPEVLAHFSLNKLIRHFIQICHAVDYAHSRGVIHCDLKPANILVGPFGEVLVVDWGFCHIVGERRTQRGGTPGFLAPEQLDPRIGPIDPRTDVFALGAVLYDILCLQHAFPILPMPFMLDAVRRGENPLPPPTRPSERAPERKINHELDEICLRALSFDPSRRFPSARDMADALDVYLEGTKAQERRVSRARELTEQGDLLANHHREIVLHAPERATEVNLLRASVAPWSSPEEKQALWDAEDREAVMQSVAIRTFQAAVAAYEHALDEVPEYPIARLGLARLYWDALQRAQDLRDEADRVYFEGLVNQYDDDTLGRPSRTEAALNLRALGPVSQITLLLLGEVGRRLQPVREWAFKGTEAHAQGLDPGAYVARIEASAGLVSVPLSLRTGANVSLAVDITPLRDARPGEIFIPAGEALLGGHETSLLGRELTRVDVPAFFLDEFPVTFAQFFAFLEAVRAESPERFEQLLPRTEGGDPFWDLVAGRWVPLRARRWSENPDILERLPVVGVDLDGALAFAQWRSLRQGGHHRLPTESEWEKAARGTDGRAYPWGDKFDAAFCKMRDSRPGVPHPEPAGAFSADVSPYGVRDMAGGVAEWVLPTTISSSGRASSFLASRGGAWCDWRSDCHCAARRPYTASERSDRVGFRLARAAREE